MLLCFGACNSDDSTTPANGTPNGVPFSWDGAAPDSPCPVLDCVRAAAALCPVRYSFGDCTESGSGAGRRVCLRDGTQLTFETSIYTVWKDHGQTRCQSLNSENSVIVIRDGQGTITASLAFHFDSSGVGSYEATCGGQTEQNSQTVSTCWARTALSTQYDCLVDGGNYCTQ